MKFSRLAPLALLTSLLCSNAFAVLSGYYTSTNELKTILDSKKVHQRLGSEYRIQSIVAIPDAAGNLVGRYDISAPNNNGDLCTLNVRVKYLPRNKMDLVLAQRSCKSSEE